MISLATAKSLKEMGLNWIPSQGDRFSIPTNGMEEEKFIVSEMTIQVDVINGREMIMFNGASEWAMDYINTLDAVWLPSEEQLRSEIEARLVNPFHAKMILEISPMQYKCVIFSGEKEESFTSSVLSEAYGQVLCYLLASN